MRKNGSKVSVGGKVEGGGPHVRGEAKIQSRELRAAKWRRNQARKDDVSREFDYSAVKVDRISDSSTTRTSSSSSLKEPANEQYFEGKDETSEEELPVLEIFDSGAPSGGVSVVSFKTQKVAKKQPNKSGRPKKVDRRGSSRRSKRSSSIHDSLIEGIVEMQGDKDALSALLEEAMAKPPPKFRSTGTQVDGLLKFLFEGEQVSRVTGTGAWYNSWLKMDVFDQFVCDSTASCHVARRPNDSLYWIGPTFWASVADVPLEGLEDLPLRDEDSPGVGIWDGRWCAAPDFGAYVPVVSFDDVTLYRVRSIDESCLIRCVRPEIRWAAFEIIEEDEDMFSRSLSCENSVDAVLDVLSIPVVQSRLNPFTTEQCRGMISNANHMFLWAQMKSCPPELMRGLLFDAQKETMRSHAAAVHGGRFSRLSWLNFLNSAPLRLFSLTSAVWRSVSGGVPTLYRDIRSTVTAWTEDWSDDRSDPPPPPPPGGAFGDQDRDRFGDRPTIDLAGKSSVEVVEDPNNADIPSNPHFSCKEFVTETFTGLTKGFSFGLGFPLLSFGSDPRHHPLGWEDRDIFEETLAQPILDTEQACLDCCLSFARADWVDRDFIDNIRDIESHPLYLSPRKGFEFLPVNRSESWLKDDTSVFAGFWSFGWPLYSPKPSEWMTMTTAVLRLGPQPPFTFGDRVLEQRVPWVAPSFNREIAMLTRVINLGFNLGSRSDSFLDVSLEGSRPLAKAVVADCANAAVRMHQLMTSMTTGESLDSRVTCFTKIDEFLLAPKPRLIHNVPASDFWAIRTVLQRFSFHLDNNWFLKMSDRGEDLVTLTYGGGLSPPRKSAWMLSARHPTRSAKHILVGGDDILIVCHEAGEVFEIEIDISKCDQSHNFFSLSLFCAFHQAVMGFADNEFYLEIRKHMTLTTPIYKSRTQFLATGVAETTLFNTAVIGVVAALACLEMRSHEVEDFELFYGYCGFATKVSKVPGGMGTFHKGFWDSYGVWLPLPSRFCKFGWMTTTRDQISLEKLISHLAGVARGWHTMDLDPVFAAFLDHFPRSDEVDPVVMAKQIESSRAWIDWDWNSLGRTVELERVATFYAYRYKISSEELSELVDWIRDLHFQPGYVYHPTLYKIMFRDYRCDTARDFERSAAQ